MVVMRAVRVVVLPVVLVAVVATVVLGLVSGREGALGALLGAGVVIGFLGSTPVILTPIVKASAMLSLPVAVGFFAVKSVAVLVVLVLLLDVGGVGDDVDPTAFGITAIVTALTWTVLQVVAFRKQRVPTYDLDNKNR